MPPAPTIKVALVDDHKLFRKGMVELINGFSGYSVLWEANDGKEFTQKVSSRNSPDIVLLDINMPVMDGYATALWLKKHHPGVKVLALSMDDHEEAIIRMLQSGARGYILKDSEPADLLNALHHLVNKGFYYSDLVSGTLLHTLHKGPDRGDASPVELNERETEFLRLCCQELTYREIATRMCLAARTVDGYRESLFEKLKVKTRVGLVLYAIKHGIVKLH